MEGIQYPLLSEKAVGAIEKQNKIVFIVSKGSKKSEIKKDVEKKYAVKVVSVNTMIGMDGRKKAYVRLAPQFKAVDLAAKLKIL
ncbi:MAG: 50S ribosomal protein L23 [Candidatus Micrarchaeota archaeon]